MASGHKGPTRTGRLSWVSGSGGLGTLLVLCFGRRFSFAGDVQIPWKPPRPLAGSGPRLVGLERPGRSSRCLFAVVGPVFPLGSPLLCVCLSPCAGRVGVGCRYVCLCCPDLESWRAQGCMHTCFPGLTNGFGAARGEQELGGAPGRTAAPRRRCASESSISSSSSPLCDAR